MATPKISALLNDETVLKSLLADIQSEEITVKFKEWRYLGGLGEDKLVVTLYTSEGYLGELFIGYMDLNDSFLPYVPYFIRFNSKVEYFSCVGVEYFYLNYQFYTVVMEVLQANGDWQEYKTPKYR